MHEATKIMSDEESFSIPDYPSYEERELLKKKFHKEYFSTDNLNKKAGLLLNGLILSHYWRARMTIEDSPRPKLKLRKIRGKKYYANYVLDIDHYTNHWLWANGLGQYKEVLEKIEEIYGYKPEENKYMPEGHSYYIFDGKV